MNIRLPIMLLTGISLLGSVGCSLGLRQDYIYDRDMVYSPDDPFVRGNVYKTHIGHDGHYYNCDDEEQKRYAPWIQWRQRPCDSQSCRREINELFSSYDDAVCRWKMGSCQICPGTNFPPGAGYGHEAGLAVQTNAGVPTPQTEMSPTIAPSRLDAIEVSPAAAQPAFGIMPSGPVPVDRY